MLASLLKRLGSRRRLAPGYTGGVRRLHLGCGTDIRLDWINLDARKLPGVDGDWRTTNIVLTMDSARHAGKSSHELFEAIRTQRNVVVEMIATLRAVKPARAPDATKSDSMSVEIKYTATKNDAETPRSES